MSGKPVLHSFGPQSLPPRLALALRRVQMAERSAVGEQRRPTFRLMRDLLGASIRLGVSTQSLADHLGTRRESVRNRASSADGYLSDELVRELTDLSVGELDELSGGQLAMSEREGGFSTIDVVHALLRLGDNDPSPVEPGLSGGFSARDPGDQTG